MSDAGENAKYKWTQESTTLLVSVWTDRQVQKQLEFATKPQLVWESVARYMCKKGYNVTSKQCRSRMKHILVCYREAKKTGTGDAFEQHYDTIDKVFKNKKFEPANGVDTVDSSTNVKSPPKDVKTTKNMQMRYKYQPVESMTRTEALSPTWATRDEGEYPDSPESNETVLAQPFRVLSPVRDAATNTRPLAQIGKKAMLQKSASLDEVPIKQNYRVNTFPNNCFSEIPLQNTVQNFQNQIIQENMQHSQALLQQNLLQNQLLEHNRLQINPAFRQNLQVNQALLADPALQFLQNQAALTQNLASENILRMQNQQNSVVNNRAMPQEPRKNSFRQNLATTYRQYQDALGAQNYIANVNQLLSPSISPDFTPNLNDGYGPMKNDKIHNLNETFIQPSPTAVQQAIDATTMTNNATFNDDTLSIEFLQESRTPSEDGTTKSKEFANSDDAPNAPFRKKKAQKLEQLMVNAIHSQNDVVNKILAAQNDMVNRFLDLDRDRQNRLENRLDHLLDVVHATVLNKSPEKEAGVPPAPIMPTNLVPPPKPGVVPPKLDLVPPKPCRVPCTTSGGNFQTVAQNPGMTRPGVISPVMQTPTKRIGSVWTKLGPVSQSPFVRAQQQLGFRPIPNGDIRTKSSAERRIARELEIGMDTETLIFETNNFLDAERELVEKIENARLEAKMAGSQTLSARKKLFSKKEPTAAIILTAAFLEAECQSTEILENARIAWERENPIEARKYSNYYLKEKEDDKLLSQNEREAYECFRNMSLKKNLDGSDNTSTPAKVLTSKRGNEAHEEPRQTIQQLAQMVMNSARWRSASAVRTDLNMRAKLGKQDGNLQNFPQMDGNAKTLDWLQDKYSLGKQGNYPEQRESMQSTAKALPMGFTTEFINRAEEENKVPNLSKQIGFICDDEAASRVNQLSANMGPLDQLQLLYAQRQQQRHREQPFMTSNGNVIYAQNRDLIDRYMEELYPRKVKKDKDTESDDDEYMDTTNTLYPPPRKGSLSSLGSKKEIGCILS